MHRQNLAMENFAQRNALKIPVKSHKWCSKMQETFKNENMREFLVFMYIYQDFAQAQQNFAPSHDGETVTLRNSAFI